MKLQSLSIYKKYYFKKHANSDWTVHTSHLENETYGKAYNFEDGFSCMRYIDLFTKQ